MAVAIFYNTADLIALKAAAETAIPLLTGSDRTLMNRIVTALVNIPALPIAPVQYQQGDPDTRIIVISAGGTTKTGLLDLFERRWTISPQTEFLRAIWKDMRTSAIDPWLG